MRSDASPFGIKNYHALPGSCQYYSIGIFQVESLEFVVDVLPLRAFKCLADPVSTIVVRVAVPTYADPIQLKTLDCKFSCYILQVVRRPNICAVVQKPVCRVDLCFDVYPFWPQALGT